MKTRQMSLLRVLSVMVLLLFAAPMMDGVLTLFQNESFDETTFFETSVYAHPENPTDGQEHRHKLRKFWDKCKDCSSKITEYTVYAFWIFSAGSGSGGSGQQTVQATRQADEQVVTATKECAVEVCPPPPPDDGSNDGSNDDS